jgi:hypothetical protein
LYVDEPVREKLLVRLHTEGVSEELIKTIKGYIEDSVVKFQKEAEVELKAFEDSLKGTVGEVEHQYAQAVEQEKLKQKQADQEEVEKIRKQLSSL